MQNYYETLAEYERDGFTVIVDKTYEDLNPRDCFDTDDIEEIIKDIDRGHLEWFMLRVRVLVEGLELGSAYLGGCLYEDPREVLTDGIAEDFIDQAMKEARPKVYALKQKFAELSDMIDRESACA